MRRSPAAPESPPELDGPLPRVAHWLLTPTPPTVRIGGNADGSGAIVLDEWETAEGFQQFFGESQEIGAMMAEGGVTSEPKADFWHALDTPDAF